MRGEFNFANLQQLVDAINALKTVGLTINYNWIEEGDQRTSDIFQLLLDEKDDFNNVEYVLKDMENNNDRNRNFYRLIAYLMYQPIWTADLKKYLVDQINTTVLKMIIEYTFKNAKQLNDYDFLGLFAENDTTIRIYMKTRNEDLLEFIIKNLGGFDTKQFTNEFMDIVVKHVDRDSYLEMTTMPLTEGYQGNRLPVPQTIMNRRIKYNALVTKKYDDAVKRRVTDISAGFGYQEIPTAVLDAIVGQSVDTSGMTAYKVNKIIDKFNIWKTDTTMRIGENEDNFQPEFQDAEDEDDDVIEI